MKTLKPEILFLSILLVAGGCASSDQAGMSFAEGREAARKETGMICSSRSTVGTHMRRVECRDRAVIDATSERAQKALRDKFQKRAPMPQERSGL